MQEYVRTGYVWEQYDALSGEGKRRYVNPSADMRMRARLHSLAFVTVIRSLDGRHLLRWVSNFTFSTSF